MVFRISRTSLSGRRIKDNPPCEEAELRTINSRNFWIIDLPTMSDLVNFAEEHGELIMSGVDSYYSHLPTIEIYDDYRD